MPFKDPEAKKRWTKEWKRESIANGYGKWLYSRRAARFADASDFRLALEAIADMPTSELNPDGLEQAAQSMQVIAQDALLASEERHAAIGPAPKTVMRKAPTAPDDTLMEALAKLKLEQ